MTRSRPPIRVELLFGALYGLGLAISVWLPLSSAAVHGTDGILFVTLAALAGALAAELAGRSGPFPAYPAILAAHLVHGPGAAVLTAVLAVGTWSLLAQGRARMERISRLLLETSKLSLATAVAGGSFVLVRGGEASLPWSLAIHATSFATVDLGLSGLTGRWTTPRWHMGRQRSVTWRAVAPVATAPVAWLVAAAHADTALRAWLVLLPWTLAAFHLGRLLAARSGRIRQAALTRRSASICRALALGLARAAASTDPALAGHQRRVEWLSRVVAERMGLPHTEAEALSAAALLHESDRVALLDGTAPQEDALAGHPEVATHPTLATELVSMIRFPYPVLSIVRHARERWDGGGRPDGLAGVAIPRGARILAVADYLDSALSGRGGAESISQERALARLREEAGRRFDPVVVDLVAEYVQAGRADARFGTARQALQTGEGDLELLGHHRRVAGAPLALEDRLTLIAARTGARLAHRAFVVYLVDEARNRLTARFVFGKRVEGLREAELPLDRGVFGLALAEERPVVGSPADLPRAIHESVDVKSDPPGAAGCLIAPLSGGGAARGLLVLYDAAERSFSDRDRRLALRVARIVGSAIAESPRSDRTRIQLTDPATGLPNARYLRQAIARRLAGPGGRGAGFGLVALAAEDDLDEDLRLSAAGKRLASQLRPGETLARFGTDQFVLLTPVHRPSELVERTQRIVRELASMPGAAVRSAHAAYPRDGQTADGLLSALDARMALSAETGLKLLPFRQARSAS